MSSDRTTFLTYVEELKWFLRLGVPLMVTYFFNYLQLEIAVAFAGHLRKEELDAWGLAMSYYTMVVVCLYFAIAYALSGRLGQAYGAKRIDLLRDDLHRGVIMCFFTFFGLSLPLLMCSEYLLNWVSPSAEVTVIAGEYLLILAPGGFLRTLNQLYGKFCEGQNIALPSLVANVVMSFAVAGFCSLFVSAFKLGGHGPALAISLTSCAMPVVTICHSLVYKKVRATRFWRPSWSALNPALLMGLFGLVCSSLVTTVVSWFAGEVGEFLAGRLGKTELAAQTVVINFSMIFYCIPVGLGSACTSRIAQYVGQGSEHMAKVVYRLTIIIHTACGLLTAATYVMFRSQLVGIFTDKEDVTELAVSLTAWVALTDIGNFIVIGNIAVLRAVGVFTFSAVVFFVVYYPFALPTAIALMYATDLGLLGYWLPFTLANFIQCVPFFVYIACINWRQVIEQQTAVKHPERPSSGGQKGGEATESSLDSGILASFSSSTDHSSDASRSSPSAFENSELTEASPLLPASRLPNRPSEPSVHSKQNMSELPQFSESCILEEAEATSYAAARIPTKALLTIVGVAVLIACVDCLAVLLRVIRPQILTLTDHEADMHSDATLLQLNVTSSNFINFNWRQSY